MVSRKRTYAQVDDSSEDSIPEPSEELSTLQRIRRMWEFAALMQYMFLFGKAIKLDDIDVEDFEDECLEPGPSEKLSQMALALLKNVSSHKGLTLDILDEYTRRQYVAKAPRRNPFGEEDEARRFADFDVFTKIRVLQQLATWTLNNPNPIREKLDETENEQLSWRIEPFGWDKEDRVYFVLDDNRLYRRTDAPPPPDILPPKTPTKGKKKSNSRNTRSNKRRRVGRKVVETSPEEESEAEQEEADGAEEDKEEPRLDDYFMKKWELIAVTLADYNDFIDSIGKTRDANERALVKDIRSGVFPVLEAQEEERKRKEQKKLRELELMQKLASSKRSSRLAGKQEHIRQQREAEEAEQKRLADLEMAHREQRKQHEMEQARESRRETREQRMREREVKRILEEERLEEEQKLLSRMGSESGMTDAERGRISERQLKADIEKRRKELESLQPDESWYFDCVCGVHGQNLDDGSHSIACEECSTWQHSKCNGIDQVQAEREDFHFVCKDCKKKAENPVKLKLKMSSSPPSKDDLSKPKTKVAPEHSAPTTNGAKPASSSVPSMYPEPPPTPPQKPRQNGNPSNPNGTNGALQWHAYQPPQPAPTPYTQNHSQQHPRSPRQPLTMVSMGPGALYQSLPPHQQIAAYSPPPKPRQSAASPSQPLQSSSVLPPRPTSSQGSSTAPQQARLSQSGYNPTIPPPVMFPNALNGIHSQAAPLSHPTSQTPSTPSVPPASTPAAQRTPIYLPQQPILSPGQGQLPFNATPGYSPTKSPQAPSVASPSVLSPPSQSMARFEPPKAATGISPTKQPSSPTQPLPYVAPIKAHNGETK